jgi:hypothetical protein
MVATVGVYPRYRALAERCAALDRGGLTGAFMTAAAAGRVAEFLDASAGPRFPRERRQAPSGT